MRRFAPWAVGLAALVSIIWAMLPSSTNPVAEATPNTPNVETIKALTVTTASYTCAVDGNGLVAFDIGALKSVGNGGRKWSDAVSTPYVASELGAMLEETKVEVCKNPHHGVMVANFFANLKLGGFEVTSVNPWLNEFKGDGGQVIHVKAASYVSLLNVQNPTNEQVTAAVNKNREYQELANKLNTLLSKFVIGTVQTDPSVLNYHLLGGGLVAGNTLPAVGLNDKQEDLPAIQLYLTQKDQTECLVKIGFNIGDKRLEQFSCTTPPPMPNNPGQPARPTPPGQPGCEPNCHTVPPPPPPGCKKPCNPPTTISKDAPGRDPAPQGNAPVGGGRNEDPGPGVQQPYTPPPNTPYVPPPLPPAQPGPPAGSTPTSNTPPPVETGANPPGGGGNDDDGGGF